MLNKLKEIFNKPKELYIFKDSSNSLYIKHVQDYIEISGKSWLSSPHTDAYKYMEDYCLNNKIFKIDLSQCNITSRLISKIENIYLSSKEEINLIISQDQEILIKYLIIKYSIKVKII